MCDEKHKNSQIEEKVKFYFFHSTIQGMNYQLISLFVKISTNSDESLYKIRNNEPDREPTNSAEIGQLAKEIHNENLEKLKMMSDEQIMSEKKDLESKLNPNIIAFIKSMKNDKTKTKDSILKYCQENAASSSMNKQEILMPNTSINNKMGTNESIQSKDTSAFSEMEVDADNELKELPEPVVNIVAKAEEKSWVHMDELEPEKFKWMEDLADEKKEKNDSQPVASYNARFDFNSNKLKFY